MIAREPIFSKIMLARRLFVNDIYTEFHKNSEMI
jgi:hypothetical protein